MSDDDSPDVVPFSFWAAEQEQPYVLCSRMEIGKRLAGTGRVCETSLVHGEGGLWFETQAVAKSKLV